MGIIEWGALLIKDIISTMGYPGIVFLMGLESACMPVPSEIVLPFAGWLAYEGQMDVWLISIAGTLGCTLGSLAAYFAGSYGGRPFISKYGKYIFLNESHIEMAEEWFSKYGDKAVFFSRLLPIVRTFISLPAGIAKMDLTRFTILSTLGSFPWCLALAYAGLALGPEWENIIAVFENFQIIVLIGIGLFVAWYLFRGRFRPHSQ